MLSVLLDQMSCCRMMEGGTGLTDDSLPPYISPSPHTGNPLLVMSTCVLTGLCSAPKTHLETETTISIVLTPLEHRSGTVKILPSLEIGNLSIIVS